MKTQKSVILILVIIIILLIIGFGTYIYLNKTTTKQNITTNNNLTLNLSTNPLITSSTTPTLTGTYSGDYGVGIVILNDKQNLPQKGDFSHLPNSVLADYSDHGGNVNPISPTATSGTFTYTVEEPLKSGAYTFGVYVYHNIYTDQGYQGDSVPVLTASTTLIIQ